MGFRPNCFTCIVHLYLYLYYTLLVPHTYASYIRYWCIFFHSRNTIQSSSISNTKKHRTVSRSSTEAEYRQLAYTAAEISWLWSLLKDLGVSLTTPLIWCNNINSISLASNPVFHARTKHLEVDYHHVRDKVVRKELDVSYICTTDQVADVFTKGLSSARFKLLANKLMVCSCPISLRGCDNQKLDVSNSKSNIANQESKHIAIKESNSNSDTCQT